MFSLTQITMSMKVVIFISLFTQTWSLENEEINWLVKFKNLLKEDALTLFAQEYGKRRDSNNSSCSTDLQTWNSSFFNNDTWALQMLDSGGRIPYGLLKGNFNSLGQYGECVGINHTPSGTDRNIIGKRCLIRVPIPEFDLDISQNKMIKTLLQRRDPIEDNQVHTRMLNMDYVNGGYLYNLAICIPASCPAADLESTLNDELMSLNITLANITVPEVYCYTDTFVPYSSAEIGGISFFSVWAFIVLLSTLYDVRFEFYRKDVIATKNLLYSSFSAYTNSKRLITLSKEPGPLGCLHGMRSISIIWIIMAHGYSSSISTPLENIWDFWEWMISYVGMTITASSISVDTFFLMSGLLLSYIFFKKMNRHDCFAKTLPTFYLHRYLRLTPVHAAVILFYATLLSRTLHIPVYDIGSACRRNWWVNLLYVQNYVRPEEMCVGQTWYLAVDMQLYILSPIVLYPLLKKPKVGVALAVFWILAAQATVYAISRVNGWWGAMIPLKDENRDNYQKSYYLPMHMRATPWLIGVLAGYLMRNVGKNTKPFELSDRENLLKWVLIILGWLAALAIMAAVLFGMHPLQENTHKFSYWEDTVYLTFHRTAWSFAVLYIIVACAYGYGGPINWFLSLRMWEFFGRLSYSIYLNHMIIQIFFLSYSNTSVSVFSNARMIYQCMGDVLCSAVLAYFMVLAFESPITVLEKIIFKSDRPKKKENTDTQLDPETLDISLKNN